MTGVWRATIAIITAFHSLLTCLRVQPCPRVSGSFGKLLLIRSQVFFSPHKNEKTFTFSRRFYPKRLTYVRLTMYTHFTFTLMAHCTSGAIRGSVSCSRTLRQGIE